MGDGGLCWSSIPLYRLWYVIPTCGVPFWNAEECAINTHNPRNNTSALNFLFLGNSHKCNLGGEDIWTYAGEKTVINAYSKANSSDSGEVKLVKIMVQQNIC